MQWQEFKDYQEFCDHDQYKNWMSAWNQPKQNVTFIDYFLGWSWELQYGPYRALHRTFLANPWPPRATRLPYWLLDSLDLQDFSCVDIGCGENIFTEYNSKIWGVDPNHPEHRNEELTPEWYITNWNKWDRVFSLCALHFWPQQQCCEIIDEKIQGIMKQNGKALVSLNRERIKERTINYDPDLFKTQISNLQGINKVIWIESPEDAPMDGNIWMWFDKIEN